MTTVEVQCADGYLTVEVSPSDTVRQLKQKLHSKTGVSPDDAKLYFRDDKEKTLTQEMSDSEKLLSYGRSDNQDIGDIVLVELSKEIFVRVKRAATQKIITDAILKKSEHVGGLLMMADCSLPAKSLAESGTDTILELYFKDNKLDDKKTFQDYGIEDGAEIILKEVIDEWF